MLGGAPAKVDRVTGGRSSAEIPPFRWTVPRSGGLTGWGAYGGRVFRALRVTRTGAGLIGLAACVAAGAGFLTSTHDHPAAAPAPAAPSPSVAARNPEPTLSAAPAPAGLPVIDYWTAPRGFPADPAAMSLTAVTEGLQ